MGKCTGMDKAHSKCTFPAVYGVEESRLRMQELTDKAIEAMAPFYDEGEFFVDFAQSMINRTK